MLPRWIVSLFAQTNDIFPPHAATDSGNVRPTPPLNDPLSIVMACEKGGEKRRRWTAGTPKSLIHLIGSAFLPFFILPR